MKAEEIKRNERRRIQKWKRWDRPDGYEYALEWLVIGAWNIELDGGLTWN